MEYDVSAECRFMVDDVDSEELVNIINNMKESERLTKCVKTMIDAMTERLESEECREEYRNDCDYKIIVLAGLILCMNLTICRKSIPENWFFSRDSEEYKLITGIIHSLFVNRDTAKGKLEWRSLMCIMCSFMGLFSYFNN